MVSQPRNHLRTSSALDGRQAAHGTQGCATEEGLLTPIMCLEGSPTVCQILIDMWWLIDPQSNWGDCNYLPLTNGYMEALRCGPPIQSHTAENGQRLLRCQEGCQHPVWLRHMPWRELDSLHSGQQVALLWAESSRFT